MHFPQISWHGLYQATPMAAKNKYKYAGNVTYMLPKRYWCAACRVSWRLVRVDWGGEHHYSGQLPPEGLIALARLWYWRSDQSRGRHRMLLPNPLLTDACSLYAGAQDHPAHRWEPGGAHLLPKVRCGHFYFHFHHLLPGIPNSPNTLPLHTHSWAQLDELVIEQLKRQEIETLQQMDASCRERMLLAGVRIMVGGAAWCESLQCPLIFLLLSIPAGHASIPWSVTCSCSCTAMRTRTPSQYMLPPAR